MCFFSIDSDSTSEGALIECPKCPVFSLLCPDRCRNNRSLTFPLSLFRNNVPGWITLPRVAMNEGRISEIQHKESYKGYANAYATSINNNNDNNKSNHNRCRAATARNFTVEGAARK